jgi:hypothetical protein
MPVAAVVETVMKIVQERGGRAQNKEQRTKN